MDPIDRFDLRDEAVIVECRANSKTASRASNAELAAAESGEDCGQQKGQPFEQAVEVVSGDHTTAVASQK